MEQVALLGLEGDARATKRREDLLEVFHVLPRRLREDDDVVEVHEAALPLESPEDHIDGPLEDRRGVRQIERKADVAIGSLVTNEGRLFAVFVCHGHLPIT